MGFKIDMVSKNTPSKNTQSIYFGLYGPQATPFSPSHSLLLLLSQISLGPFYILYYIMCYFRYFSWLTPENLAKTDFIVRVGEHYLWREDDAAHEDVKPELIIIHPLRNGTN